MSSFNFMKANIEEFQESNFLKYRGKECGLSGTLCVAKVVEGSTSKAKRVMSDELKKIIEETWRNVVGNETGYQTYDELRVGFRKKTPLIH